MRKVVVPYGSWYFDGKFAITFPKKFDVFEAWPKGAWAKPLAYHDILEKFNSPIGTERISELAKGKRNIVILVDDLTRPTPTHEVVPFILDELEKGGVCHNDITFITATGLHRPLNRFDLLRKLGREVVDKFRIIGHSPYENLSYIGVTSRGTPIYINKMLLKADLKIGIGGIYPHQSAGWSGGGKIICPGVSGIKTVEAIHSLPEGGYGVLDGNEFRENINEVTSKVGLDIIVNLLLNCERKMVGLFIGDMIKAHREGVKFAEKTYATKIPKEVDVGIINTYPADTELIQTVKGLWPADSVKENGVVVILAWCTEGFGWHGRYNRLVEKSPYLENLWTTNKLGKKMTIVFSPNVNSNDVSRYYPKGTLLLTKWKDVISKLRENYRELSVLVVPCAPLQLGSDF